MNILEYGAHPAPPSMPEVVGIFVGGCIARGVGSSFRAQAHAHTGGEHRGWICVRSRRRVYMDDGRPSRTLMHEYAHVITGHGHDETWRAAMRRLNQPLPKRYQRKARRRTATSTGGVR